MPKAQRSTPRKNRALPKLKPDYLLIACGDPRTHLQVAISRYMNQQYGKSKWIRLPNLGGLTYCLNPTLIDGALDVLWIWIQKLLLNYPSIKGIVIMQHEGCAMAENFLGTTDANDMEFHARAAKAGADWLIHKSPNTGTHIKDMRIDYKFLFLNGSIVELPLDHAQCGCKATHTSITPHHLTVQPKA